MEKQYYTVNEAAEITGLSTRTINRILASGKIPRYKYSTRVLIPRNYLVGEQCLSQEAQEI